MDLLKENSCDLFCKLLKVDRRGLKHLILKTTLFIHPEEVRQTPVVFPTFVRTSEEHHKGKQKGDSSVFGTLKVSVTDNTKARLAFGRYTGHTMGGKRRTVPSGWNVAHIWGLVYDPNCFTAGWNFCLMPDFLRNFAEEQSGFPEISQLLQQVSYDLYIAPGGIVPKHLNEKLKNPGIDLKQIDPTWTPHLLSKQNSKIRSAA